MGQSKPSPSRERGLKSYAPLRSEIRPQWLVRPPIMRDRHHLNSSIGCLCVLVYGSPGTCQPPFTVASWKPNGLSGVRVAISGASLGACHMGVSVTGSYLRPASSITHLSPARVSVYAACPPPAPEPTITTSYSDLALSAGM